MLSWKNGIGARDGCEQYERLTVRSETTRMTAAEVGRLSEDRPKKAAGRKKWTEKVIK